MHIEGEALEERFEADVKTLPVRVKTLSGWVSLRPNPDPTCVFDDRALRIYIYRPTIMAEAFLEATSIEPISKMTTIAPYHEERYATSAGGRLYERVDSCV